LIPCAVIYYWHKKRRGQEAAQASQQTHKPSMNQRINESNNLAQEYGQEAAQASQQAYKPSAN